MKKKYKSNLKKQKYLSRCTVTERITKSKIYGNVAYNWKLI